VLVEFVQKAISIHDFVVQFYLQDHVAQGKATFSELYCTAQHPGRVLPRLYLMVITACCAMKSDPGLVSYYLGDLLDFVRGIQHPMRGLFLRSFLNTSVRGLLPDTSGLQHLYHRCTITADLPLLSTPFLSLVHRNGEDEA
jgi:hypothetical protein